MSEQDNDPASRPDDDNPEWTEADFASARPVREVLTDVFGREAAERFVRGKGRPANPDRKINQTLRLDPDVLAAYRQIGPGWQTHINQVLRDHMPGQMTGGIKAAPRPRS